jgi:hypothetical protein
VQSTLFLTWLGNLELVFCLAALCVIVAKKQWADYWSLGSFLAVRVVSSVVLTCIHNFHHRLGDVFAYDLYFYIYWSSFAIESILGLMVIYSIFRLAMAPLKGLQSLGMLVFRWAAAISVAVSLGSAFAPGLAGQKYIMAAVTELQRTQGILTLCLLLFVCFAIRPMGLSYSSRIFGVSLGLGMLATANLVQSAWLPHVPQQMKGSFSAINGLACCATVMLWTAYFALPEPKRRIIVLPTTSPFLRWNQISLALGDAPGFVAVGGVPPELFAPAELEVMRRASLKMVTPFPKSMGA